jgi:hypothetical protein
MGRKFAPHFFSKPKILLAGVLMPYLSLEPPLRYAQFFILLFFIYIRYLYKKLMLNTKGTTSSFIEKAKMKHGDRYDYSLVRYNGAKHKVKIICPIHGEFEQQPTNHLYGQGCGKCSGNIKLDNSSFIEKAKIKHGDKYDYSLVSYLTCNDKVKIICPIHGEFEQRAINHLRGDGCSGCSCNRRLTNESFIERAKMKHGDKYDYSLIKIINNLIKIKIICPIHGEFEQKPNNHINGNGCPKCKESKGEIEIRNFLINNEIKFFSQHRFIDCRNILPLPFDFYLPNQNICIEFNGRQHYVPVIKWGGVNELEKIKYRDKIKMEYCRNNNIPLIIIKYNDNIIKKLTKLINPEAHGLIF